MVFAIIETQHIPIGIQRSGDTQVSKCNITMQRNISIRIRAMMAGGWSAWAFASIRG